MVRLKNRYVVTEVVWKDKLDETLTEAALLQALRESVARNFGDFGLGRNLASLQVKYFSPYTGVAIVRCATADREEVLTSMTLLTDLRQRTAVVRPVRLAGTVATCKAAAVELSARRLAGAKLSRQQRTAAEQAHAALQALEL